jgi:large-conductance mechanosensitive channel
VNFLIVAFSVFVAIKAMNKFLPKKADEICK